MKLTIIIATSALALTSCGQQQESSGQANTQTAAAAQNFEGSGKVTATSEDQVTISHGPIQGLGWPAMTMGFKAPSGLADGITVGSNVSFAFRQNGGTYVLTRLDRR